MWVMHLDLDQFIAAVEILRNPQLRGLPVIVGGDGDPTRPRQVVATSTYEAREHGVHSGMPLRTALHRCPDAVFLPSDPPAYEAASERVMAVLRTFPITVEVWGWDEAFIGTTTDHPEKLAAQLQQAVLDATHLSCSVGIGDNKHQAKLASAFAKPAGIHRLTTDTWATTMNDRPTDALWGIGAKISKKLADLGLHTVAQLAAADPATLAARFGPTNGPWYRYLALGKGETSVTAAPWVPRGRSHEITFTHDLTDRDDMLRHITDLAQRLAREAQTEGRTVTKVTVKKRVTPFLTSTRQTKLTEATTDPATIAQAAVTVFDRFEGDRPVRLLGVAVEYTMP